MSATRAYDSGEAALGPRSRNVIVCVVIALAVPARGLDYAWWVTARFAAQDLILESLPIKEIDPSWVAASLLRDAKLPPEAGVAGDRLADHGATFELLVDPDGHGHEDKLVVGVYRAQSGEEGTFLLVLSRSARGWRRRALFTHPWEVGFSALIRKGKQIFWVPCLYCDSSCELIWAKPELRLECTSCCEGS